MDRKELEERIGDLSVWSRGDQRAPHKPLLLLWALGRCAAGEERLASFEDVDESLKPLLQEFGPPRKSYHTEYPFWYLQNDALWEVHGVAQARVREGKAGQPTKGELIRVGATGGLTRDAFKILSSDPALLRSAADSIVDGHFPDTLRGDLLSAVGLEEFVTLRRRKRDPRFRETVLVAYGYSCAVCSFDARIGNQPVGIEAAHIKWHQAHGPDDVTNGLALCSLHHKLFDRGAFTLGPETRVVVSDLVNGGSATDQLLLAYVDHPIQLPRSDAAQPNDAYVEWHRAQVFRAAPF